MGKRRAASFAPCLDEIAMSVSGLPFDDIRGMIASMPGPDMAAANAVRARDANLTKPAGSLGRLEEIAEFLAAWQGKAPPRVDRPLVCVFAGNHGVVAQGVSAYPQSVTRQMLENFAAGGAAINQICAAYRSRLQGLRPRARSADRGFHARRCAR